MDPLKQQNNAGEDTDSSSGGRKRKILIWLSVLALLSGAGWYLYSSMAEKKENTGPVYEEEPLVSGRREEITIEEKGNLGIATTAGGEKYLVDRDGMTLYYNTADEGQLGTNIDWSCNTSCERNWLPYLVDESSAPLSASSDPLLRNLNAFKRPWDSRDHYAINSKLLYRFRGDKAPGDMGGENWGEGWMIARP